MFSVSWISGPNQLVLWAQVVLGATLVHYTLLSDWSVLVTRRLIGGKGTGPALVAAIARGLTVAALSAGMTGLASAALLLAGWTGAIVTSLGVFAAVAERHKLDAELEITGAILLVGGTGWIIGSSGLSLAHGLLNIPLPPHRLAAICLAGSIILYAGRGGTHIVRGVLGKAGAFPRVRSSTGEIAVDAAEYGRGRLIGDLERLLLVITIALNAYAAMGFIIAAKGLIRIKEFENRDFAEYFLIGTFTSVVVALILGLTLRATILGLW